MLEDNESLSAFHGYRHMKNSKEKIPDCLVNSCKRSSVNRMAAGLRLPRSYGYKYMKIARRKIANHLADFCKCSRVSQMGLQVKSSPVTIMEFEFLFFLLLLNILCYVYLNLLQRPTDIIIGSAFSSYSNIS